MPYVVAAIYGLLALVALTNLLLMPKPGRSKEEPTVVVLIPARDEANNLRLLLPNLLAPNPALEVIVFDDESSDGTASVGRELGAKVIQPGEPLPEGWTGKNRACHELAIAAAATDAHWFLFLDADVRPSGDFLDAMRDLCRRARPNVGVITGFPTILSGRGIEPLFLAWVGWILLAANPYGLVRLAGIGHNRFKNGQVHCWRREVYERIQPNAQVRSKIMEDVMIGRLLARHGVDVEVANLSSVLAVRMYETWRETLDGMSKNAFEITESVFGSILIAALFLFFGWGWLFAGKLALLALGLLLLSGLFVAATVRSAIWPGLLMPLIPTIGAYTVLRSAFWHRTGQVKWKGRTYGKRSP